MFDKRISLFTGHYGSGKTEVAVNYAIKLSQLEQKTAIVDFDIVNPYFRTKDAQKELENRGIWVVASSLANTNVDIPALPPEIYTLFEKKEYKVVFDVGGDDAGAKAVSRYRDEFSNDDYEIYCVINAKRPMTDTVEKIEEMVWSIEESSRLKITKLVNNTNLLEFTTLEDILEGQKLIESVSKKLNIPIGFVSGLEQFVNDVSCLTDVDVLSMEKLIRLPWDKDN